MIFINQSTNERASTEAYIRHDVIKTFTAIMVKDSIPAKPITIGENLLNLNRYVSAISLNLPNTGEVAVISHYAPPRQNSIYNQLFLTF